MYRWVVGLARLGDVVDFGLNTNPVEKRIEDCGAMESRIMLIYQASK